MHILSPNQPLHGTLSQPMVAMNGDSISLNFLDTTLPASVSFARASQAYNISPSGQLMLEAVNAPRLDRFPTTLQPRGLLLEGTRTNLIRNGNATGAVTGTPGTLPTNWVSTLGTGMSREVVGSGTLNGFPYVDIRFFGTPTTSPTSLNFEANTQIATANAETMVLSAFVAVVGGNTAGLTSLTLRGISRDAGGTALTTYQGASLIGTLSGNLERVVFNTTVTDATAAFMTPLLALSGTGSAVDLTLRIAAVQYERNVPFASSYIPTTGSASATRAADMASVVNLQNLGFNPTEGTIYTEFELMGETASAVIMRLDNGTIAENIRLRRGTATPTQLVGEVISGSTNTIGWAHPTIASGTLYKAALAYKTNDCALALNGAPVLTDTLVTLPSGLTALRLGSDGGGINPIWGWLRQLTYYPTRLPDGQLQALTA